MKSLALVLVSLAALSGCAVVPAYGPGVYGPPAVYAAPTVVVPYGGYYGGYRGGYHRYR